MSTIDQATTVTTGEADIPTTVGGDGEVSPSPTPELVRDLLDQVLADLRLLRLQKNPETQPSPQDLVDERVARRNQELLHRVADFLEAHPDAHDQTHYLIHKSRPERIGPFEIRRRAAVGCIAGWAVALDDQSNKVVEHRNGRVTIRRPLLSSGNLPVDAVGTATRAMELLGVTSHEVPRLFAGAGSPAPGYTTPEALRALAAGARLQDVWV